MLLVFGPGGEEGVLVGLSLQCPLVWQGVGAHAASKSQILCGLASASVEYVLETAAPGFGMCVLSREEARWAHNAWAGRV